jgi:membrane protein
MVTRRHRFVSELVGLVREVIGRYGRLGGSQFAAAISYRALFSLVPLATFVATVLAQVLSTSDANRQDLIAAITEQLDLTAEGAARLDGLIAAVPSPWSIPGLIALGLALWGATGVMSSVLKTVAVVFDEGVARGLVRGRLVSALLVLGALGLILCAVIVSMLENAVSRMSANVEDSLGWQPFGFGIVLGVLVPLAVIYAVFLLLYRFLPRNRPGWRAALLGSAAAAIGFQAVQIGLGWYLAGPSDFSKVYGSASTIFAFLFSVYLSASAFVICAILTAVLDERLPLRD